MKTMLRRATMGALALAAGAAMAQQEWGGPDGRCGPGGGGPGGPPPMAGFGGRGGPGGGPQGGSGGGPGGRGLDLRRLEEQGVSAEKIAAVRKLELDGRRQGIELRSRLENAELDLEQLIQAGGKDRAALAAAADAVGAARSALYKAEVLRRVAVSEALGEEVMKKLRESGRPPRGGDEGRGPARERGGPQGGMGRGGPQGEGPGWGGGEPTMGER